MAAVAAAGERPRLAATEAEVRSHLDTCEVRAKVEGLAALGAAVEVHAVEAVEAANEGTVAALLANLHDHSGASISWFTAQAS